MDDTPRAFALHCDSNVLHAPKSCEYCDWYPDWQALRERIKVNFTGEHDPNKLPCPAEVARPLPRIYGWPGNVPRKPRL